MFPLPLLIEPRSSPLARRLLLLLHLAALAALFLAEVPPLARVAGVLLLAVSLTRLPSPALELGLRAHRDGRLEIRRDATWKRVALRPDSVALPWLIVLRWREDSRHHHLVLPGDALSRDEHRRLRVWLRWKARFADAVPELPFDSGIPGRLH